MCRALAAEGVAHATALAHQNWYYPANTADRLRAAAAELAGALAAKKVPLSVHPTGEVMLSARTLDEWRAGRLMSVGDHRRWLLVEMPHDGFVDALPLAAALQLEGVGLIVAHAERYPELLDDPGLACEWAAAGCLLQVTARALADPPDDHFEAALKRWAAGGLIHLLGSDGHGLDRRRPELAAGFRVLAKWAGRRAAGEIACRGVAVLCGEPVAAPRPAGRVWFARLFGG
jgi:protein-tyrosine phosphatase